MKTELEKLILDWLPYAFAIANRVGDKLDRDERKSVVHLATTEAAWAWLQKKERAEFKPYLAAVVQRHVLVALTDAKRQTTRNGGDRTIARRMVEFADSRDKRVEALERGELAAFIAELRKKTGRYVSLERIKAVQSGFGDSERSLDAPILLDGNGVYGHIVADSRAYGMNPEAILIAREEFKERNRWRLSPEKERQLFFSWVEWLPKRQRQVMLAAHVWEKNKKPNFRNMCARRHGGNHVGDYGLSCTPQEAEIAYQEAIEILRAFARGDFKEASFEEVVRTVPGPLVERFITELEDPLEQYVVKQRLLTTYKQKRGKYTLTGRPTISTIARVWRARIAKRMGKDISKEEAQEYVHKIFASVCRRLAVQVGIAPLEVLKKS